MTSRSRPLWPLLTAALIGLPVLYVASFGPAVWIARKFDVFASATAAIYWPIGQMADDPANPGRVPLVWYAGLFGMSHPGTMNPDFPWYWGAAVVPVSPHEPFKLTIVSP